MSVTIIATSRGLHNKVRYTGKDAEQKIQFLSRDFKTPVSGVVQRLRQGGRYVTEGWMYEAEVSA